MEPISFYAIKDTGESRTYVVAKERGCAPEK
jgi:hypothetical protein